MSNIKWAILGPGTVAEEFAEALNEASIGVYAVGSRNILKAEKFAKIHSVKVLWKL
ncbi:putative dehydrogenase [Eubacterium multiforme]|uniref:Dehydrogenase n=1 Tax=Eubacterium multiforme TaxID=83339 RepID=A0ABT9UPB7_9FIRM|nr:putative dehydrogenase [Eubacterium multiforme]